MKEKEEKLAAAKKEREDKIAAIKAELTQKYGGNRFRIILDPPRYYDQNKDIRQALVKELKASTAIALLDKVPQLPKKSVDEMNDQELREYLMATYFAPEATVQLEFQGVSSIDIKKKESAFRLFSSLPEQSVCKVQVQYYINFVDPEHYVNTEIIYASGRSKWNHQ